MSIASSTERESNNKGSVVDSTSTQRTPNSYSGIKRTLDRQIHANSKTYSDFFYIDVDGRGF